MKKLGSAIYAAVRSGRLRQPFDAAMVKAAVPGWNERTYSVFLPKHRQGNPGGNTVLFVQAADGRYRIANSN